MRPCVRLAFHNRKRTAPAAALLAALVPVTLWAAGPAYQNRLLNVIDQPAFPGIGAWQVEHVTVRPVQGLPPRVGAAAAEIMGTAQSQGAKVDAPAFDGALPGCRQLAVWAAPGDDGNVTAAGFQVCDAKGEWLMQTVPVDWKGWKQITIDPTAGGMRQAYEQKDHDGKADLPLRSVHLIWFAKQAGSTSMRFDGLSAMTEVMTDADMAITSPTSEVLEPGNPLSLHCIAENHGPSDAPIAVRYTLQANPTFQEPLVPDPVLGFDHALGAKSTASVDGVDKGDAKLCDGSEFTGFETPWGAGYKEVVATIDLGQTRQVSAVRWQAGDANWIDKADLSISIDGTTFQPVAGAQRVEMRSKWGGPHSFPWPQPTPARYVRFRFHKDGESTNCVRLPPTIMVYDGVENDKVEVPQVGPVVASGSSNTLVKGRDFADLAIQSTEKLGPGAYLLALELSTEKRKEVRLSHLFVRPADEVPAGLARRFGINGSDTSLTMAQDMRRVGFGWMRFENAKWQMYMPARDRTGFTGTTAPWNLNYDQIFGQYHQVGLNVLPYVFQPPAWASGAPANVERNREGYPPKDPADYGEAIFQLVARFGRNKVDPALLKSEDKRTGLGWIDAVELWNEPNLNDPGWGPFIGTMKQYFEVMRAGVDGARRADPSLPVTAGGLAGIDLEVVGLLSEHHYADGKTPLDLVDVVNVHFYSGREEPETAGWDPNVNRNGPSTSGTTYPEQLEALVAWRDHHKPKAEIWLTEIGNDVGGPIGLTERHQAAKLPRGIMLALAAGIERVFIYRESGSTPSMHAGAGLLRNDGSTRPSWITVATMIRQLQGFEGRALRLPSPDPNAWILLWQQGDRRLVTAWTLGEPAKLGLDLGNAQVCDAFGHTTATSNTAEIGLSYFPVYISLGNPGPKFAGIVADARKQAETRAANVKKLSQLPMQLFDFGSSEHVGMLKSHGLPRRFTAVTKDQVWDGKLGYGFSAVAGGDDDRRWVSDPLERDGCKVGPETAFRLRLNPGRQTLRVRAQHFNDQQSTEVIVKTAAGVQSRTVSPQSPIAEFAVDGSDQPIQISLKDWGILRWLTAIPQEATTRP